MALSKTRKRVKKAKSDSSSSSRLDDSIPNTDVFAVADNLEEAMRIRGIVAKHCEWPLIYEKSNGTYEIGGLTRHGGKLTDDTILLIWEDLENSVSKKRKRKSRKKSEV